MKLNGRIATAVMLLCIAIFGIFFARVYMGETTAEVKHHETCSTYEVIENLEFSQWDDPQAPVGVRQEYKWRCPSEGEYDGASLAFYLVHQGVEVYYEDEMVYALYPSEKNSLTHLPGSRWVMLPLHDFVHGCDVRMVVTPYYEDIIDRVPEFYVGSLYHIFLHIFRENLLYVVMALLALIAGSGLLITCICLALQRRWHNHAMGYMAIILLLIGIWRITDTRLSGFLFPGNAIALDYITIGTLHLVSIPFGLVTRRTVRGYMYRLSVLCAAVCMLVMTGHMLNWWDMRNMLPVAYGMIIINTAALMIVEAMLLIRTPTRREAIATVLSLCPIAGALADIISYYVMKSSEEVFFAVVGFLAYGLFSFLINWQENTRKMYTDVQTGLHNRARWERLMNESDNGCGIILFDLNGLKRVNDKLGHEAGDIMICSFADILRSAVAKKQTLCRWGGDEFAIHVPQADAAQIQTILEKIRTAVEKHNASAGEMSISYAVGCVVASEHPGMTNRQLFRLADERMYIDKNR